MEHKETLTNEALKRKFPSQFDLVNYMIRLAENMIRSGRDARVRVDSQNRAVQIIAEVAAGKDFFEEIPVERKPSYQATDGQERNERGHGNSSGKNIEAKKSRKALVD